MCGRYRIKDTDRLTAHLRATFGIPDWVKDSHDPRFNIAPWQDCPVVTMDEEGDVVVPAMQHMRWGFIPPWEQAERPKMAPINAKAENVATTGLFRNSLQKRRCLVVADGFYEWQKLDERTKLPFDLHLRDNRPFFFAGIYEQATATRPATFAILTTRPNELVARIHDRMPVILEAEKARQWVKPGAMATDELSALTQPIAAAQMEAVPISSLVNSPRNTGPEILTPLARVVPLPQPPKMTQGELF